MVSSHVPVCQHIYGKLQLLVQQALGDGEEPSEAMGHDSLTHVAAMNVMSF